MNRLRTRNRFSGGVISSVDRTIPMSDLVASCVLDCSATIAASYAVDGNENIDNLAGSGGLWMGKDNINATDDPGFSGTIGDPLAKFTYDGGDTHGFQSVPTALANWHKTGGVGTMVIAGKAPSAITSQMLLFDNSRNGASIGCNWWFTSTGKSVFNQRGDTISSSSGASSTGITLGQNFIAGVAHSDTTNQTTFWDNKYTGQAVSHTYDATTTAYTYAPVISGRNASVGGGADAFFIPADGEIFDILFFNAVLTNAGFKTVADQLIVRNAGKSISLGV